MRPKATIEEIEAILDGKEFDIVIMPNGEIKAACKNCLKLQERIDELEARGRSNTDVVFKAALDKHPVLSGE